MCGLQVSIEGSRVTSIRGDPDDPLSRGAICPKAVALRDLHEDRDRLTRPLKRVGQRFEEIPWKQAFDEVAERLAEIRSHHGRHAVATYFGNPLVHNTGGLLYGVFFARSLRTRNKFSATSLDQLPHMLAAWSMFGHQLLLPIPDLDRTQRVLIIGANPAVSNGSLMSAPGVRGRLKAVQRRGGRLVVVDPRRTETAELADEHFFIRPGSDALWLFALVRCIFEESEPRLGRLADRTRRLDEARRLALPFTPERVEPLTGIPAATTRRIALEWLTTPKALVYGRIGICTQAFGGLSAWLINLLNLLIGALDEVGGTMFTHPAIDTLWVASRLGRTGSFERRRTRVRNLPEFGGEMPTAALAEEIETAGPEQIRALVSAAGNPVLSAPQGARLEVALERLEFMVSIDPYLNETTRHAHYILPPVSPLERDHYDLVFHALAVRNTAKFTPAVFKAPAHAREDWQIFLELTRRLEASLNAPWASRMTTRILGALGPRRLLDLGLRMGPHRLSLAKLRKSPSGLDLGPLERRLPERLFTPDGMIDAAPEAIIKDVPRLEKELSEPPQGLGDLLLIGRRELRSNNSWMHNAPTLTKGRPRCTLRMHPIDADRRGIDPGQSVDLRSKAGSISVPVEITDELMPGVVSLPHGYGHGRQRTRLGVANQSPGASINDVTEDGRVDLLTGNAAFSGVPVWIETDHHR